MPDETPASTTPDTGAPGSAAPAVTDPAAAPAAAATPAAPAAAAPPAGAPPAATPESNADGKKTEAAPEGEKKVEVPEVYDFKAPDGMQLDEAAIGVVTPVLKKLGITQEGASELTAAYIEIQKTTAAKQSQDWLIASKADKEIGGAAFDANSKLAMEAFGRFATPEFKAFMDATGLGNHPEMLRAFIKIGKAAQSDTHVPADAEARVTDAAKRLFPNTK